MRAKFQNDNAALARVARWFMSIFYILQRTASQLLDLGTEGEQ